MNPKQPCIENINLSQSGHPLTDDLAGKAVRLNYQSGHVLEQHWQRKDRVFWKGIEGTLEGHSQTETYRAVEITKGIYLITWLESNTVVVTDGDDIKGPWLTDVVLDFNTMRATASWMGPRENGQIEYVLDQAEMTFIDCEKSDNS